MSANNNNNKQQQQNNENDFFHMDINDDFIEPLDNFVGFNKMEEKMINNFNKVFNDLLPEKEEIPRKEEKEQPKENKLNNGTVISQVYCSSYNNLNGQPHQECYQSSSIEQMNDGHNISEARENYKNSDGVMKTAYQRGLDKNN